MNKILKILKKEQTIQFLQRHGITHLAIIGSYAKNTATKDSDIDFVYETKKKFGWEFFDITQYLEHILQKKIDMVQKKIFVNLLLERF